MYVCMYVLYVCTLCMLWLWLSGQGRLCGPNAAAGSTTMVRCCLLHVLLPQCDHAMMAVWHGMVWCTAMEVEVGTAVMAWYGAVYCGVGQVPGGSWNCMHVFISHVCKYVCTVCAKKNAGCIFSI